MRAEIIRKKMQKTVLKQGVQIIRPIYRQIYYFYKAYNPPRIITSFLRTLPDFSIIGSSKCGSTSLYRLIIQHPDIAPAQIKEIHYFNRKYSLGQYWYRSNFPTNMTKNHFYKKTGRKLLTLDSTVKYIHHPMAPIRMKKILPDIKLIAILRNPIDRAYSAYHYNMRSNNKTSLSFEKIIELSKKQNVKMTPFERITELQKNKNHKLKYLTTGIYADQLENWFKYYDKKQFLFLTTEDFHKNTQYILDQVFDFLGLNPFKIGTPKRSNVGNYKEKMNADTRKSLIEYFKPHNERLYKLLQRDFGWDK